MEEPIYDYNSADEKTETIEELWNDVFRNMNKKQRKKRLKSMNTSHISTKEEWMKQVMINSRKRKKKKTEEKR